MEMTFELAAVLVLAMIAIVVLVASLVPKNFIVPEADRLRLVRLLQNRKKDETIESVVVKFTKEEFPQYWEQHGKTIVSRPMAGKWTGIS